MNEAKHYNMMSSMDYWFEKGREGNSLEKLKEKYDFYMSLGSISPDNLISYVSGIAYQMSELYFYSRDIHFKNIDSFFFSKKKRMFEAESLNNLGLAEKIIFEPEELFGKRDDSKKYVMEVANGLKELETGANKYRYIKMYMDDAKTNIKIIGNEFLKNHLGFDIYNEPERNPDFFLLMNKNMRSGILDLAKTANQETNGEKKFPYAAEFLDNHVFMPSKEYFKNIDLDSVVLRYVLLKINSAGNRFL